MDKTQKKDELEEKEKTATGAELVVDCLIKQGVKYIFGIPGAKIDTIFDVLKDRGPELIVCRHEQNAAFMAAAVGRLTCKAGVCLVTSGPGASNLATGIVTANVENDPVVALAGAVPRADRLKRTHQSMDNAALFQPITKYSAEVVDPKNVPEVVTNAFRAAESTQAGASVVSFPQDVLASRTTANALGPLESPKLGTASEEAIDRAVEALRQAKMPVILAGMRANRFSAVSAVRSLLQKLSFPVVETFQAAGLIPRNMEEEHFFGRVGLFRNQPGDLVLDKADVILTVGYDSVEYDPKFWNKNDKRTIIHLDEVRADIDHYYQPAIELVGDIPSTIHQIKEKLAALNLSEQSLDFLDKMRKRLDARDEPPEETKDNRIHPLQLIHTLRHLLSDKTTVTCDVGSHYIWMARHFRSYEPKTLLFSNGMQTLGVALPWAMAASLVNHAKTVSMSGDGGFLFSAMELETAVRLKLPVVHIVWRDGTYDMVAFQQQMKYQRTSGVDFGKIDVVKYAEAFGAKGLQVHSPEELESVLKEGLSYEGGPVIIDVPVDYSDNVALGKSLLPNQLM